jgi:hypothetical protein
MSVEDMEIPPFRGVPSNVVNVILVRSAENVFASRIRKSANTRLGAYSTDPSDLKRTLDLWLSHAREMLGITSVLPNRVGIYFDHWCTDEKYRARIAEQIGIAVDDASLEQQAKEGGGSSFNADLSGVLSRRELLTGPECELLDQLLKSGEVQDLSRMLESCR